jgi:hypothetical protein
LPQRAQKACSGSGERTLSSWNGLKRIKIAYPADPAVVAFGPGYTRSSAHKVASSTYAYLALGLIVFKVPAKNKKSGRAAKTDFTPHKK